MVKKGQTQSEEAKEKIRQKLLGRKLTEEHKNNISKGEMGHRGWNKGRVYSVEVCKKVSLSLMGNQRAKGNISPFKGRKKYHINCLYCKKEINSSGIRKFCNKKCEGNYRLGKSTEYNKGEKNFNWNNGSSLNTYPLVWTKTLKRKIRERDKYRCYICKKEGHQVHHIDYNKDNCSLENLITLCLKCHNKTQVNRKKWIKYFKKCAQI